MFMPSSNLHYYSYYTLTKQPIIALIQLLLSPKQLTDTSFSFSSSSKLQMNPNVISPKSSDGSN